MKTSEDLNSLIPTIINLISEQVLEIGETGYDEDGRYAEYAENCIRYEEDGWLIEVVFECCGNNDMAWGKVTEIEASWLSEDWEEEVVFGKTEFGKLWESIDEYLRDIA